MTSHDRKVYWRWRTGVSGEELLTGLAAEVWGVDPALASVERCDGVPWVRLEKPAGTAWVPGSLAATGAMGAHSGAGREAVPRTRAAACLGPGVQGSVGIDAEAAGPFLRSGTRAAEFAAVILADAEHAWFRETARESPTRRLLWLLRAWVRKEAALKALHTGLDTARGGLAPQDIVLTAPWEAPHCRSHSVLVLHDWEEPVLPAAGALLVTTAVRTG